MFGPSDPVGAARVAAAEKAGSELNQPYSTATAAAARANTGNRNFGPLSGWDHDTVWTRADPCVRGMLIAATVVFIIGFALMIVGLATLDLPLMFVGIGICAAGMFMCLGTRCRREYDNKMAAASGAGTSQASYAPAPTAAQQV